MNSEGYFPMLSSQSKFSTAKNEASRQIPPYLVMSERRYRSPFDWGQVFTFALVSVQLIFCRISSSRQLPKLVSLISLTTIPDMAPILRRFSTHSCVEALLFFRPLSQQTQIILGRLLHGSAVALTKGCSLLSQIKGSVALGKYIFWMQEPFITPLLFAVWFCFSFSRYSFSYLGMVEKSMQRRLPTFAYNQAMSYLAKFWISFSGLLSFQKTLILQGAQWQLMLKMPQWSMAKWRSLILVYRLSSSTCLLIITFLTAIRQYSKQISLPCSPGYCLAFFCTSVFPTSGSFRIATISSMILFINYAPLRAATKQLSSVGASTAYLSTRSMPGQICLFSFSWLRLQQGLKKPTTCGVASKLPRLTCMFDLMDRIQSKVSVMVNDSVAMTPPFSQRMLSMASVFSIDYMLLLRLFFSFFFILSSRTFNTLVMRSLPWSDKKSRQLVRVTTMAVKLLRAAQYWLLSDLSFLRWFFFYSSMENSQKLGCISNYCFWGWTGFDWGY